MDPRQTIADVFGLTLIATAIVLSVWEVFQQRAPDRDRWFVTKSRCRRRLVVSALLAAVGVVMSLEARGILLFEGVAGVLIYAGALGAGALLILILALVDIRETVGAAAKKSLEELKSAIEEANKSPTGRDRDGQDRS